MTAIGTTVTSIRLGRCRMSALDPEVDGWAVAAARGLRPREVTALQDQFNTRISRDVLQVLKETVPVTRNAPAGKGFPAWTEWDNGSQALRWFNRPAAVALAMVQHVDAWCRDWGPSPVDRVQAVEIARAALSAAPDPWPISHETFQLSNDVGGPTFVVHDDVLGAWLASGYQSLCSHLGLDYSRNYETAFPQPWHDLIGPNGVVNWWSDWTDEDDSAFALAISAAKRVHGGISLSRPLRPSLEVNALLRGWAKLVWARERGAPMSVEEYDVDLQVRRQLDVVVEHTPRSTATKLRSLLEPFDRRFAGGKEPTEPEWWLRISPQRLSPEG